MWAWEVCIGEEVEDKVRWMLTKKEVFTIKSMFKALMSSLNEPFP